MKFTGLLELYKSDERFNACAIDAEITEDGVVTLTGEADTWRHLVDAGLLAGKQAETFSVVSKMTAADSVPDAAEVAASEARTAQKTAKALKMGIADTADIVIIGAGVVGCGIARELSKYNVKVIVAEKASDVSEGTTKANNGYIHPGHKAKPGTLKAKLNVRGNAMYDEWARELGFRLSRYGQINVAYTDAEMEKLKQYCFDGLKNGVPDIRLLSPAEIMEMEPAVEGAPVGGLYVPSMAMVEPYQVCVALAENAAMNGVKFMLENEVLSIETNGGRVSSVLTEKGRILTGFVVNAAGVHADKIAAMAGDEFFTLHGRRGGILIFDKAVKAPFSRSVSTVAMNNDSMSKGGGFSFTPEGNIIAGPSAMESADREDGAVFPEDIEYAYSRGASIWSGLRRQDIIAMYAGVRAADFKEDFIITLGRSTSGILHVAGIQSPGLASAPAIAEMALKLIAKHRNKAKEDFSLKNTYNPLRPSPVEFRTLTDEEKDALIRKRPEFGNVICRCEEITEGEILEAIRSPIVPTTVDAIKRRTRAGMGRCQGGFCQPRVVEILARELGKDWTDIMLKGREAYILDRDSRNGDADMTKEAAR